MKWTWLSMPPAVTIRFSPAMTSVPGPMTSLRIDARLNERIAGLADADDAAAADADVALDDAPVVEDDGVGDDEVELRLGHAPLAEVAGGSGDWPWPSRMTLPPPNCTSSP